MILSQIGMRVVTTRGEKHKIYWKRLFFGSTFAWLLGATAQFKRDSATFFQRLKVVVMSRNENDENRIPGD